MNKIGVSTTSLFPLPIEKIFPVAKAAGFRNLEVLITGDKKTRDVNLLKKLANDNGIEIISLHAPTLLLTQFVWGTNPGTKLLKTAEMTAEVGADTVVVHPPFFWQGDYSTRFLDIVSEVEHKTGVKVAVENMFPWRVNGKEMKAYKPSWSEITDRAQHLTLDFSHAALSGLNSLQVAHDHWEQITHIHLCDGIGTSDPDSKDKVFDEHLLPGEGNQQVSETLQFLKSKNWDGTIVSEINTRGVKTLQKVRMIRQSLKFAETYMS
jgi:sugar phosphate isomerase/epimerase